MALQRPMQFRWDVTSPVQQLMVISKNKLWVYDKDLEQITVRSLTRAAGEIPGLLLSDAHPLLNKDFYVTEVSKTATQNRVFLLRAKNPNNLFASIQMVFKNQVIDQMQLTDFSGQLTLIRFNHIRMNNPLDARLFRFVPPPGVDIIDETKR